MSYTQLGIHGDDSSSEYSTVVGSALERRINDAESARKTIETSPGLVDLRKQMAKHNLDY